MSRLLYDPYAPAEARWVLVWLRFLRLAGMVFLPEHAWIGMRTAAAPSPVSAWNPERKVFAGISYNSDGGIIGPPEVSLGGLSADLSACAIPSEPGLLATPDGLWLSLYCAGSDPRIVLLRQSRQSSAWSYVGTFATALDATRVGADNFSATDLFETADGLFLLLSPETAGVYSGCMVYPVVDLATAALARNDGVLAPSLVIPETGDFGGACGYVEGVDTGILYSRHVTDAPEFRVFATYLHP